MVRVRIRVRIGVGVKLRLGWDQVWIRNSQMLICDYEIAQLISEIAQIAKSRATYIETVTVEPIFKNEMRFITKVKAHYRQCTL